MKKCSLSILLMLCTFMAVYAGSIKGIVINSTGEKLEFATILLKGTNAGSTTDSQGQFYIKRVAQGRHTLIISSVSYKTKEVPVAISSENEIVSLGNIVLESNTEELNEVVVVGNANAYTTREPSSSIRLNQPLLKIPQNVQVVSSEIMSDQQIVSMSDGITRNVSGVTRLEHWGDSYALINMRGSRASAFREGMNVTSSWGPLTEDMSFVDRIEFIKGPAGFMMSNGEPSGIYNVVTKKPTGQTKGQASLTFGSYDFYRTTLDLDGKLDKSGKLLYRFNAMAQSTNSQRAYESAKRYSIAPVISYQLDDNTKLTAEYDYQYMESSNIGSYYSFSPDGYATLPQNYSLLEPGLPSSVVNDHSLILNLQHNFNKDWKLTAQGAYFNYNREGSSMWPSSLAANGDLVRSVSIADVINEMKFGQIYINGKAQTGFVSHNILAGFDTGDKHAWYDWSQSFDLDSIGTYNIFDKDYSAGYPYYGYPKFDRSKSLKERANTTQVTQSYSGLYFQDELGLLNDRLRLTLAGRYTYVKDSSYGTTNTEEKHFSPRVGLSYSIDKNTSGYALYDQTFSPQMGMLRNGDKVNPITGNNWELGLKRNWFNNRWTTTVAVYQILKNNETASDPNNTPQESYLIQVGQSKAKGVEVDILGEILPNLSMVANYAYTDYRVTKSVDPSQPVGTRLPGYAKHDFNIWLKYSFTQGCLDGFNLSAGQSTQLDRSTWSWGSSLDNIASLPDYFRFDAALGWKRNDLSLALNIYNVFDRYLYSGSSYQTYYYWQSEPPRNFRLSVTYNF
ncbi:TonB-dependent siderophore receptor [uncultured Bacteroides sp.]|uniref:TonB-dependent siderophore receptor n=1 Tax=uncultured Bacteroides sp. TaxID=162156 RepID=UPI002AA61797|nr:TonB-dependent siderophore receptor [uncultured Bacteroides sp.]